MQKIRFEPVTYIVCDNCELNLPPVWLTLWDAKFCSDHCRETWKIAQEIKFKKLWRNKNRVF